MIERLLNRFFEKEEINGHGICPTYLYRWTIGHIGGWKFYVHHFVGDDWSKDLHDHPKRFVTVGVKGRYLEESPANRPWGAGPGYMFGQRIYTAPWIRTFPANHIHRIEMVEKGEECWTLVMVMRTERPWGFWHKGVWMPWQKFVTSDEALESLSC